MNIIINNATNKHKEVIIDSLTMSRDLAIGDVFTLDRKLGNMGILGDISYNKLSVFEAFRGVFYKSKNIDELQNTLNKNIKTIDFIIQRIKGNEINLSLDETSLLILSLEQYTRIGLGQFQYLDSLMYSLGCDYGDYSDKSIAFDKLKNYYFPQFHGNGSYGIFSIKAPEGSKIAWDIYQVLRYEIDKNKEMVNCKTPLRSSNTEELIDVKILK